MGVPVCVPVCVPVAVHVFVAVAVRLEDKPRLGVAERVELIVSVIVRVGVPLMVPVWLVVPLDVRVGVPLVVLVRVPPALRDFVELGDGLIKREVLGAIVVVEKTPRKRVRSVRSLIYFLGLFNSY